MTLSTSQRLALYGTLVVCAIPGPQVGDRPPQFRSGTDLIRIDVSVLDHNRQPARGLIATDFKVFEDGVEQPIAAFTEVDIPDSPRAAGWVRDVAPDVRRNDDLGEKRLTVLVLDDAVGPGGHDLMTPRDIMRKTAGAVIDRWALDVDEDPLDNYGRYVLTVRCHAVCVQGSLTRQTALQSYSERNADMRRCCRDIRQVGASVAAASNIRAALVTIVVMA
jgi:hypothetical protein